MARGEEGERSGGGMAGQKSASKVICSREISCTVYGAGLAYCSICRKHPVPPLFLWEN